jgi:flagellar hook protein FlgE
MQKAETQLNTAANKIAQSAQSGDTLDLSSDMVSLITARDNFMANVGAAKSGDEMQRALLNLIA